MAEAVVPTISVSKAGTKVSIDPSIDAAKEIIAKNPKLQVNFALALLFFLGVCNLPDTSTDGMVVPLTAGAASGMGLFAVGHEYGHVIKGHVSPTTMKTFQLSLNDNAHKTLDAPVLLRSWQQELEADSVGFQLLRQVLKSRSKEAQAYSIKSMYDLHGPLFYFECMQILEDAKYALAHGAPPPQLSDEQMEYIRAVADAKASPEQQAKFRNIELQDHPPPWLRLERLSAAINADAMKGGMSSNEAIFFNLGAAVITNADLLRSAVIPKLPGIKKIVEAKGRPLPER